MSVQPTFPRDELAAISVSSYGVRVSGEIDISNVSYLAASLRDAIGADGADRDIVIDLTELSFLDVQGLDTLVVSQHLAGVWGRRFVLANPPATVQKLLRLTGLEQELPVMISPDVAVRRHTG